MLLNAYVVSGRLGKTPEIKKTKSGKDRVTVGFAVSTSQKVNGEWDGHTSWFELDAYEGNAHVLARYAKGDELVVEGRLRIEKWTSKTGTEGTTVSLKVSKIHAVAPRPKADSQHPETQFNNHADPDDDLPF